MMKQTSTIGFVSARPSEELAGASHVFNDNPNAFKGKGRHLKLDMFCQKASRLIPAIVLTATLVLALPASSYGHVAIGIAITTVEPPPLVVYEQPLCPGPNFIWTPGYWAWGPDGYFWVPGTWVMAPYPGELWTPGYWAWDDDDDAYFWTPGYWGPEVGFYGGIVYGFGYYGSGYEGGYWRGGTFFYNTAANNVDRTTITHVYNRTVINNMTVNNVSFNGGRGGTMARPTPAQLAVAQMRHNPPAPAQREQEQIARTNRAQFASVNHGRPPVAATAKPTAFSGPGVSHAIRGGQPAIAMNRPGANRAVARPATPTHPNSTIPEPNTRANANQRNESPANGSKPEPRRRQKLPESRPETQPLPTPKPHAASPKRSVPHHAQNTPHPTEERRPTNLPHRSPPPQRTFEHNPSPTRPAAMRRSIPAPEMNARPETTPRRTMPSRRNLPPPRMMTRVAPSRHAPPAHANPPAAAQRRETPHRPDGGH